MNKTVWVIFVKWPYDENESFYGISESLVFAKDFCQNRIKEYYSEYKWEDYETQHNLLVNFFGYFSTVMRIEKVTFLEFQNAK